MTPLPEHLQSSLRINWHISSWCNYSCNYCPVMVFHQRSKSRARQQHSFDYYSVPEWLKGLDQFKNYEHIHLKISGGEPFLDRKNFRELLIGLSERKHIQVGIDTNGYWDPDYFRDVDKTRIWVNIAFHPTQTTFEEFYPRLLKIRDSGFRIPIVNFVLAPENLDDFEQVYSTLEKDGFFVNISTMIPTGVYLSRTERTERELDIVEKYNTPLDNYFKLVRPDTKDRPCFYPAMTYYIMFDGSIRVACMDSTARDLIKDGPPPLPRQAVPCEYQQCIGCSDMYRALEDEPRLTRPLELFTLEHYAEEVQTFRSQRERKERLNRFPLGLGKLLGAGKPFPSYRNQIRPSEEPDVQSLITPDSIRMPLPSSPVFGHNDHPVIQARSRDRISISGWAASQNSPVEEVRLWVNEKEIGVIRDFFYRPDVVLTYGREELAKTGWRTMVFLPALPHGEHTLTPKAINRNGDCVDLPQTTLHILD